MTPRLQRSLLAMTSACLAAIAIALVSAPAVAQDAPEPSQTAAQILDATQIQGGLIVHLGCGDGRVTAALRAADSFQVQGLDRDAAAVQKARSYIQSKGKYGEISVDQLTGNRLPYIDNLINLVVAENLNGIEIEEVLRVLVPNGVAYIRQGNTWQKSVKPRPKNIDEWTHYLHGPDGNAVAHDEV